MRTILEPGQIPTRRTGAIGGRSTRSHPPTGRTTYGIDNISLTGWPSRGGIIVLNRATVLDFEFLGLNLVHPPMRRNPSQDAEDKFCQRLLMLGAKWFDSRVRYAFVSKVADEMEPAIIGNRLLWHQFHKAGAEVQSTDIAY